MASCIVPTQFQALIWDSLGGNTVHVDLFTNNHTAVVGDVGSAFTVASYTGYAQFNWNWLGSSTDDFNNQQQTPAHVSFNAPATGGSAVTVYGFIVRLSNEGTDDVLVLCGNFDVPIVLNPGDGPLVFDLTLSDYDATHPA